MTRTLFILALVTMGLVLALRGLQSDKRDVGSVDYLRPLVAVEGRELLSVAGISVRGLSETNEEFLYVQRDGQWRCESAYDAIALTPEIEALVRELTTAYGEVVAHAASRAADYGFSSERPLIVGLHGPGLKSASNRDLLLELELGASLPGLGAGRGYARFLGSDELLEIDQNPRAHLAMGEQEVLPPMLDKRLLAGEWPKRGAGISRAFIDYTDGRSVEVRSSVLGPSPEPGAAPLLQWLAVEGDAQARCLPYRIAAWQGFLYRVPYLGLSDPAAAERRGLDAPVATITLLQIDSAPIELVIGRSAPTGATFVLNRKTGQLCLMDAAEVELLLATVNMLCADELANPWEAWLPK